MPVSYNSNYTLSGQHLAEFLQLLKARTEQFREQETALLAMRNDEPKPPRYQHDLQLASENADIFDWLHDKIRERIDTSTTHALSAGQLNDIIFNYRGRNSQPTPLAQSEDAQYAKVAQAFKGRTQDHVFVFSGKNEDETSLGLLKLEVREKALGDFLGLYHVQEGKVDEWISKEVFKLPELQPDLAKNGVLNPAALEARPFKYDGKALGHAAMHYIWSMKQYQDRPHPGGPLDVFYRAKIQRFRSEFEKAVAAANPDAGPRVRQLEATVALEAEAKQYHMNLQQLQGGITF